jgi:hypothetical protein
VTIFELDDRGTTQRVRLAATRAARLREVRERFGATRWQTAYRRRIFLTDAAVVVVTALVADLARMSFLERHSVFPDVADRVLVVAVLVAGWMLALGLSRSYDAHVYGSGPLE